MAKKWDGPKTESTEKRGQEIREDGVVEGKAVPAMVVGGCIALGALVTLLVIIF